jgi:hypothetical protein
MHCLPESRRLGDLAPTGRASKCGNFFEGWLLGRLRPPSLIAAVAVLLAFMQAMPISSLQAQGQPVPAEQYMFDQAALERGATNIGVIYNSGVVRQNPDGKPLAQWTVDDIKSKFIITELNIRG